MALIKCPECGKNISDKAIVCPNCGCPKDYFCSEVHEELPTEQQPDFFKCYKCGRNLPVGISECPFCYYKYEISHFTSEKENDKNFQNENNLKPYFFLKKKKHKKGTIYCPKCGSINVEFIGSDIVGMRDPVTKTTTKINLNPLKPFTLFSHEDKIIRKGSCGVNVNKWHCKECGYIFRK